MDNELQRILTAMTEQVANDDTEVAHSNADDLLCDLATALAGEMPEQVQQTVRRILELYGDVYKWFA